MEQKADDGSQATACTAIMNTRQQGRYDDRDVSTKRQYIAMPPMKVPVPDATPKGLNQTVPLSACETGVPASMTPVLCSLTPTHTPRLLGGAQLICSESAAPLGSLQHTFNSSGGSRTSDQTKDDVLLEFNGGINVRHCRRSSSLVLGDLPLSVDARTEHGYTLPTAGNGAEEPSEDFERGQCLPEWYDSNAKCFQIKNLPKVPDRRSTLDSRAAQLSAISRVYHRHRNLGEHAMAKPSGAQQHKERGVRRRSCPELIQTTSVSVSSLGSKTPIIDRAVYHPGSSASTTLSSLRAATADNYFEDSVEDSATLQSRRVRFSTVSHIDPGEISRLRACNHVGPSNPARCNEFHGAYLEGNVEEARAARELEKQQQVHSRTSIGRIKTLIQRLRSQTTVQEHPLCVELLDLNLRLLQQFEEACGNQIPSFKFFAETLELCRGVIREELEVEFTKEICEIANASKYSMLSPYAVNRLKKVERAFRYPEGLLDILLPSLNKIQTVMVSDQRRASNHLSLLASTHDSPLLHSCAQHGENIYIAENARFCAMVSTRNWGDLADSRGFGSHLLNMISQQQFQSSCGLDSSFGRFSLSTMLENALKSSEAFGKCSVGMIALDAKGEKLRLASSGFVRVVVFRRSRASGLLFRVTESPTLSWASACEGEIYKWPSLLKTPDADSVGKERCSKDGMDLQQAQNGEYDEESSHTLLQGPILRHALQLRVGLGEATSWNCSGVVEQVVSVLEGDFFCVADEALFEVVTTEEMRHIFSRCLTTCEAKDASGDCPTTKPSALTTALRRLWLHRVPARKELLDCLMRRKNMLSQQVKGRPYIEVPDPLPLDLTFIAGWVVHGATQ